MINTKTALLSMMIKFKKRETPIIIGESSSISSKTVERS